MKKRLLLLLLCLTLLLTGCAAGKEQMPVFRIYGLSDTPGSDAISAVTVDWSGQKSLTVDRQAQAALEAGRGCVIDCVLDMDEMVRPMVPGGAHITDFLLK